MKSVSIRGLLGIVGLWVAFAAWGYSSPVGSSPDDDFHIGSIWCAGGFETGLCEPNGDVTEVGEQPVLISVTRNFCYIYQPTSSGKCFEGEQATELQPFRANAGLYPGGFYKAQHLFVGSDSFNSIYIMRLFNSAIAALFLGVALFAGNRSLRPGVMAAWTFTLVPLAMFIVPSTSPSSWAYIGLATNWVFLYSAMKAQSARDPRAILNWIMYFASAALCIFARSDAAVYVAFSSVLIGFVAILSGAPKRKFSLLAIAAVLLSAATSLALTNQGRNFEDGGAYSRASDLHRLIYNSIHIIELPAGALGVNWGLGWLDTILPPIIGIVGICLIAAIISASLIEATRVRIFSIVALLAFAYSTISFVLNQGSYVIGELVQPRYVLPLLPLFVAVVTMNNEGFNFFASGRVRMNLIISLLVTTNAMALFTNIRRYVTGTDRPLHLNLNEKVEWWWLESVSPNLLFAFGVVGFAIFLIFGWKLALVDQDYTKNVNDKSRIKPF